MTLALTATLPLVVGAAEARCAERSTAAAAPAPDPRFLFLRSPQGDAHGAVVAPTVQMTPGFPRASDDAGARVTVRQDPFPEQGTLTATGTFEGAISSLQLDLFRGTPAQDAPFDGFWVELAVDDHHLWAGDSDAFWFGYDRVSCHVHHGWYGMRVVGIDEALPSAGDDVPHTITVRLRPRSDAGPGAVEVLGVDAREHASRVVVNPPFVDRVSPRIDVAH